MLNNLYIVTPAERKEALARERRRMTELSRQNRIFDDKNREIGIDVKSLDRQIQEKKAKERDEREWSDAIARQIVKDNEMARILAQRGEQERRMLNANVNEFRKLYQRREDCRDFDLFDPLGLKKEKPPRTSDSDNISLPSGQKFAGEDLRKEERKKIMAEQESAWLKSQMDEKQAREEELKAAEYAYRQAVLVQSDRALRLEIVERDCKRRLEFATLRYNKALAEERNRRQNNYFQDEMQDNNAEIFNTLTSDLLTENASASQSIMGPHRVIPYMYKGMSPEEITTIKQIQKQQIEENKIRKTEERKIALEWEEYNKKLSMIALESNDEVSQKRRELAIKDHKENLTLASKQREKRQFFDKIMYKNEPSEEYFNKFNTTSR